MPPVRTCIGCRRRAPAIDLVRLVLIEGRLRVGPRVGRSGRGASLHPSEACLRAALKAQALPRAFRRPGADISLGPEGPRPDQDPIAAFLYELELAHRSQLSRSKQKTRQETR